MPVPRLAKIQTSDETLNRIQDALVRVLNPELAKTGLLPGPTVADSTAADVPTLRADLNALLAVLRGAGVIG